MTTEVGDIIFSLPRAKVRSEAELVVTFPRYHPSIQLLLSSPRRCQKIIIDDELLRTCRDGYSDQGHCTRFSCPRWLQCSVRLYQPQLIDSQATIKSGQWR